MSHGNSTAATRRAAARLLYERTNAEEAWISDALGIAAASLATLAAREGWQRREGLEGTVDRLLAQLSAQLDRFEQRASEAEGLSKSELDALLAITRTFDRLGEMKRTEEERRRAGRDDGEISRARAVVERRVGELSEQRATTIIAVMTGEPNTTGEPSTDEGTEHGRGSDA